jgi:RND family efflux transporter MFP subunit
MMRAALLAKSLFALVILAAPALGQGQAVEVTVDPVRLLPTSQTIPVLGRLVPRQSGPVAAQIEGPVGEVRVQVGDRVKKGDVLAVMLSDRLHWEQERRAAAVAESKAEIESAKARLAIAEQELRRLEKLRRSAAFSQARYEDKRQEVVRANSEVNQARARAKLANADLKLAEIALYKTKVRAPYPGVVSQRHIAAGGYLSEGDPVVTLINDIDLEVEADVPANRLDGLLPGTEIALTIAGGKSQTAVVRAVVPDENSLTRTRAVRLTPRFNGSQKGLAANQSATLHLPLGERREVLTVHKDAVIRRQGRTMVFVVNENAVQPRVVSLGAAIASRFEVRSGLRADDLAVVRGNERLTPGQKVTYKRAAR